MIVLWLRRGASARMGSMTQPAAATPEAGTPGPTVGLTGGIGAGKSTVAAGLVKRGAALIDTDRLARDALRPGAPGYGPVVARFGRGVVGPQGHLDRAALARVVFNDPVARADLEAIVHPLVRARVLDQVARLDGAGPVVVDIPLLDATGRCRYGLDGVIVVDAPPEVAVARVVADRQLPPADVWARVRAQLPRQERLDLADLVIDNAGSRAELDAEIDRAWAWIQSLRRSGCHTGPVP